MFKTKKYIVNTCLDSISKKYIKQPWLFKCCASFTNENIKETILKSYSTQIDKKSRSYPHQNTLILTTFWLIHYVIHNIHKKVYKTVCGFTSLNRIHVLLKALKIKGILKKCIILLDKIKSLWSVKKLYKIRVNCVNILV